MRSVLGALRYSARESRPDLSGPVSILQSRFNKAQVSDIQQTNRVVRLAEAHTDLPLLVCISSGSNMFCVLRRRQWREHTC